MSKSKNKTNTVWKGIKTAAAILVAIFVLFELFVMALSVFGGPEAVAGLPLYIMQVQSDSMAPVLRQGDSILCANVPFDRLKVGDIITFYGNGDFITHEVVQINPDQTLTTKGLMNSYTDGTITEELYVGSMLMKLPLHSLFLRATETLGGKIAFIAAVLVLMFGYPVIRWCLIRITGKADGKKEREKTGKEGKQK